MKSTILLGDNTSRNQNDAIAFHNGRKERMLSVPDVLKLVKDKDTAAIQTLRNDIFKPSVLMTSTRIEYSKTDLSAKIIHNCGSKWEKVIKVKEVPECDPEYLDDLLDTDEGISYVRALLNLPRATKKQIEEFFRALSGKEPDDVRFWTPEQKYRNDRPVRAVRLCFYGFGWFYVGGYVWFVYFDGLSRGVKSSATSAKQTRVLVYKAIFNTNSRKIELPAKVQRKLRKDLEKMKLNGKRIPISFAFKTEVK